MQRLASVVGRLSGWRRIALAVFLGALATLALPPFHLVPVLVPAFCGLLWLIAARPQPWPAAAVGWWFGFGHFCAGLYWIAISFTVAGVAPWAAPFAVLAMAATAALFPAAVAALAARTSGAGARAAVAFAIWWTLAEWLRGFLILGGFPWNLTGYAWAFSDAMIQLAAVTGVLGLTLITVLAAAMPAALGDPADAARAPRRAWWAVAAAFAVLGVVWTGGALRLAGASDEEVAGVRLRLVQANIAQHHKWRDDLRADHFARHVELTAAPATAPITLVIWPETAVPYLLDRDPERLAMIADLVPPGGLLITGAVRATPEGMTPFQVWNSLRVIDDSGAVVATYDKHHLVPFGEYVPFRGVLNLVKLTTGAVDYSPGPGPRTLALDGLPSVSPLICYEAIFPGQVTDPDDRPGWLLNVTNDGWYGVSTGPYQHLAQARLRAVEEGLPLVRAANTGISAVVDSFGRVTASLGLAKAGVVDAGLPVALPDPTPFARAGAWPFLFVLAAIGLWAWRPLGGQ